VTWEIILRGSLDVNFASKVGSDSIRLPNNTLKTKLTSAPASSETDISGARERPSRGEVLWTERTNFGEVFSRRSPDPVRDVRRREQQNDVLWARQETSWIP
jgi:hypothetical protein